MEYPPRWLWLVFGLPMAAYIGWVCWCAVRRRREPLDDDGPVSGWG